MKKFYFYLLISTLAFQFSKAQLTLTKAANEAVVGDVEQRLGYDSSSTIPKNTGLNQNWSFTSMIINTVVTTKSYSLPSAAPNATAFSGATICSFDGANKYEMYRSSGSTFELMGFDHPGIVLSLSNTAVSAVWPITYGYTANDLFSGSAMMGTTQVSFNGTIVTNAPGTGTITIPGGYVFTNCLQLVQTLTLTQTVGSFTAMNVEATYLYFNSTQKAPMVQIHYKSTTSGTTTTKTYDASINKAIFSGVKESNNEVSLSLYPNPAKNYFDLKLNGEVANRTSYELINLLGQTVKKEELGFEKTVSSRINTSGLQTGIYFMNVKVGESTLTRKIVIE